MADLAHLARTSAYFDGALPAVDEAEALAHLATCAACQDVLRDAATIDAVVSQAPTCAAFAEVVTRAEPGWADEARRQIAAHERERAAEDPDHAAVDACGAIRVP